MLIVIVGNIIIQSYSQCIRQPFIISRCFSLEIHDNCQTSFFALNYANFRVPLLLLLFLFKSLAGCHAYFLCTQLCKPQHFAFALSLNPLAFRRANFLRTQLDKHQDSLLLFCGLIFSTSAQAFSHRTLIHNTQLLLFQQQVCFPLHAFAGGI